MQYLILAFFRLVHHIFNRITSLPDAPQIFSEEFLLIMKSYLYDPDSWLGSPHCFFPGVSTQTTISSSLDDQIPKQNTISYFSDKVFREKLNQLEHYLSKADCLLMLDAFKESTSAARLVKLGEMPEIPGNSDALQGSLSDYVDLCISGYDLISKKSLVDFSLPKTNCPSLFILSSPKSASSFLTTFFSILFNKPGVSCSFRHGPVISSWLSFCVKHQAVNHDHFFPSDINIKFMKDVGIKKIVLLTRDLKESLVSLGSHLANIENSPCATFPEFQKYFGCQVIPVAHSYYRWKTSWLSNLDSFQILQISYADLKADFPSVSKRILDFYNVDLPSEIASTLYDQIKNDISIGNRKTAVREKNVPSSFLSPEQIAYIDSNFSDYF
jgi:hypothetical protein